MNYWGSLFLTFWRLEGGWDCTIEDAVEKAAETHSVGEMMFDACSKLAAAERAYEDETNRDFVSSRRSSSGGPFRTSSGVRSTTVIGDTVMLTSL
jgi:hypothetical protein